ncbi:MAG: sigma-70 family RNA polymerase sigma factor [Ruminococcaceae bacterium]|nr:sigma-70 family RNA polymerase sigma factor [Oscillospiraceae bacterium]
MFENIFNVFFLILHVANSGSFPKPLSAAQEREYILKMREGDQSARAVLIERNLRLVAHIAKKYYQTNADQDDLISIGSIGLIKAVDSFKSDKQTRLATYAARCIENEILMYFRSRKKLQNDVSINEEIDCDKDGNSLSLMDIISEEGNILDSIYGKVRTERLISAIKTELEDREKEIILLRYGLSEPALTQRETAERLGISRSYVSRIEKKALEKLRASLEDIREE